MTSPGVMYQGTAPPVPWYSCTVLTYNYPPVALASNHGLIRSMRHEKTFGLALRGARELGRLAPCHLRTFIVFNRFSWFSIDFIDFHSFSWILKDFHVFRGMKV